MSENEKIKTLNELGCVSRAAGYDCSNCINCLKYSDEMRAEAKKWIRLMQSGQFPISRDMPESMKGRIAQKVWNEDLFAYGMEYGFMWALRTFFNLEEEDNAKN